MNDIMSIVFTEPAAASLGIVTGLWAALSLLATFGGGLMVSRTLKVRNHRKTVAALQRHQHRERRAVAVSSSTRRAAELRCTSCARRGRGEGRHADAAHGHE
jgi:hypothetical protein